MKTKDLSDYKRLPYFDGVELLYAQNHTLDFPNHTHDTFNIAIILNQSFCAKLPSSFLKAPVGTICITNPYEVHATPCDKQTGNTFHTFYISPGVLKEINKGIDVFFKDRVIYNNELFNNFYFLSQNVHNTLINFEKLLKNCLGSLIGEYATEIHFKSSQKQLFQTFLMEDHFEKFSLDRTARYFGIDKYKFLRLFKQETGLTPNSFVILKRIDKAKKLISGDCDLLDVAISSGFYDAAHLCREFKRYTGVTPNTYKNA